MSSSSPNSSSSDYGSDGTDEEVWQMFEDTARAVKLHKEAEKAKKGKKRSRSFVYRDREGACIQLHADYFAENPTYGPTYFRRRFRMHKHLFMHICNTLEANVRFFQHRKDAVGRWSLTTVQKCTMALRQLATGGAADVFDEYLKIGDSTGRECLRRFCRAMIEHFGDRYLRKPTAEDTTQLLQMHEARHGFPGMLGSLDCMHWAWRNCPKGWAAAYTRGDQGEPTLILEAVASQDLWIWHAFFGAAGSNNDINVLNASPLFADVLEDRAPECTFIVNGHRYHQGYYLTDGIYPTWPTLIKAPTVETDPKSARFKKMHESARKDIERAFGVLQARWGIIRNPARGWYTKHLRNIMFTCIILHNMIIEDEREDAENWRDETDSPSSSGVSRRNAPLSLREYLRREADLRDARKHHRLTNDLQEHLWTRFGPLNSSIGLEINK